MPSPAVPVAYFITYHTYGTWLHGNENGSVDRYHNLPDTPMLAPNLAHETYARRLMKQPPYILDEPRRDVVLRTIQEVCHYRNWLLFAAHVRTNHAHVIVQSPAIPEKVMNDFKAYSSRRLTEAGFENKERKRWTRHGSTIYLWDVETVEAKIRYVVEEQGEPMAVYKNLQLFGPDVFK